MASIYRLYSVTNPELIYIGSTKTPLPVRLASHVLDHYKFKCGNATKKVSSFAIIETGHYGIELIEHCDIKERYKREQANIELFSTCNKIRAWTEYDVKTSSGWAAYQKKYYHANPLPHQLRKLAYYYKNKDSIQNKYKVKKLFQQLPFSL